MTTSKSISFPLPFDDTYWVIPGKLMAGEYPGRREELETRRRIQALIRSGIRVCIDLTKPGELTPSYRVIFLEELVSYGHIGNYFHFPVYDFGIPSEAQMQRTLDVIDQCLKDETPVYIHCHAGIGRTGLTVGCYLVRHGMNGEDALAEIKRLRQNVANNWMQSPETDEQVRFVKNWGVGD
jgi:predicted protein tyrosine phosphatase